MRIVIERGERVVRGVCHIDLVARRRLRLWVALTPERCCERGEVVEIDGPVGVQVQGRIEPRVPLPRVEASGEKHEVSETDQAISVEIHVRGRLRHPGDVVLGSRKAAHAQQAEKR